MVNTVSKEDLGETVGRRVVYIIYIFCHSKDSSSFVTGFRMLSLFLLKFLHIYRYLNSSRNQYYLSFFPKPAVLLRVSLPSWFVLSLGTGEFPHKSAFQVTRQGHFLGY